MGCTFVAAGSLHPTEVLAGIKEGVYVRRMESANIDPRSGRATFRVTDADRIRDGCIAEPLRPHLIAVQAREVLNSIDRIADDLAFDTCIGSCHRDGQTIAVSVGAPTIRIGMVRVVA
jgi:TldD protein